MIHSFLRKIHGNAEKSEAPGGRSVTAHQTTRPALSLQGRQQTTGPFMAN